MAEMRFIHLQKELFSLFEKENMEEALSLIHTIKTAFPERLDKIYFWEACALSVQGKKEEAVAALQTGLGKGIWWNPYILKADPDLKNLQTHEGFKKAVEMCEEIFNKVKKRTAAELVIFGNKDSEFGLFSMHARGTNVKDFAPYWLQENGEDTYLFGFPQSSQVFGYNAYCWDDQNTTRKEIEHAYKEFQGISHTKSNIIAGASQGGQLAIELSLGKTLPGIKGFLSVMPAIKDVAALEILLEETLLLK